jgi:metal-sulfur cluster biosynthetic enzyme
MPSLEEVRQCLESVIDPCSRFNGTPLSLTDLGMVERVALVGSTVEIGLLLDDPTCIYTFIIQKDIREAVLALGGLTGVEIDIVADQLWTSARIKARAQKRLEAHRVQTAGRRTLALEAARSSATVRSGHP